MDTNSPASAPADYLGLKEELQKIAAIIDQYPDQLKQRAFELLINAYLARGTPEVSPAPAEVAPAEVQSEAVAEEVAPLSAETVLPEELPVETTAGGDENSAPVQADEQEAAGQEPESRISANLANSTNMLRQRIRLRTMSQMPWQQPG